MNDITKCEGQRNANSRKTTNELTGPKRGFQEEEIADLLHGAK
jgi:hypothetical protein